MWHVLSGLSRMWRQSGDDEPGGIHLRPGTAVTPPVSTSIQLPSTGRTPLGAVGVTMLPWPGDGEAVEVQGPWPPPLSGDHRRR
jgi:mannose-6-phosphate isomerase-like protein (cupin superfamily)